jgi:hypothetical protein
MQSLRTRRSQADRKPKAGAKATPRPAQPATARTRDARKSRVDDKIKKRMSMRYADISLPTDAQGIPAVPALPISGMQRTYSPEPYEERDDATRERRRMDARERELKMLDEKGFDPDVCECIDVPLSHHKLTCSTAKISRPNLPTRPRPSSSPFNHRSARAKRTPLPISRRTSSRSMYTSRRLSHHAELIPVMPSSCTYPRKSPRLRTRCSS